MLDESHPVMLSFIHQYIRENGAQSKKSYEDKFGSKVIIEQISKGCIRDDSSCVSSHLFTEC